MIMKNKIIKIGIDQGTGIKKLNEKEKRKINQFHFIDITCTPCLKYLIAMFINKQIIIGITAT